MAICACFAASDASGVPPGRSCGAGGTGAGGGTTSAGVVVSGFGSVRSAGRAGGRDRGEFVGAAAGRSGTGSGAGSGFGDGSITFVGGAGTSSAGLSGGAFAVTDAQAALAAASINDRTTRSLFIVQHSCLREREPEARAAAGRRLHFNFAIM